MKTRAATSKRMTVAWLCIGAGLALLAAANGHLVYVAVVSQPDCVPHARQMQVTSSEYRAAVSSCSVK
jgi:hypothetical protein